MQLLFEEETYALLGAFALAHEHRVQLHNYLKAIGLRVGLLVNLDHYSKLEYERIIW